MHEALHAAFAVQARLQGQASATSDFRGGVASFPERREAVLSGR